MPKIILATSSHYRQEAFKLLGLDFVSEKSYVKEYFKGRPSNPKELVRCLSKLKAKAVAKNHFQGIIVGFDSVGYFNNHILEKPKSRIEAFKRLKFLSGNSHQFYTGIYMINMSADRALQKVAKTNILMRRLTEDEINKYLNQDPNFKTYALGYDPLGHYSSTFIEKIEGSYNNLTRGIPLETIMKMLFNLGYKI